MQQVSDYELELLKIIWAGNGNQAMYAEIVEALEKKRTVMDKKYDYYATLEIGK